MKHILPTGPLLWLRCNIWGGIVQNDQQQFIEEDMAWQHIRKHIIKFWEFLYRQKSDTACSNEKGLGGARENQWKGPSTEIHNNSMT
jgi:hypothetical protein